LTLDGAIFFDHEQGWSMYTLLVALEILVSVLLVVVVLMQNSKGGGLAGSFGGGNIGTVFGVRRTSDFLTRATTVLATVFIVLTLVINVFFLPGKGKSAKESIIQSGQTTVPPAQLPQQQQAPPAK
jgi:preprotein translocase subunit SecG